MSAPARARPRAMPRPMPPLPPVTIATFPCKSNTPIGYSGGSSDLELRNHAETETSQRATCIVGESLTLGGGPSAAQTRTLAFEALADNTIALRVQFVLVEARGVHGGAQLRADLLP